MRSTRGLPPQERYYAVEQSLEKTNRLLRGEVEGRLLSALLCIRRSRAEGQLRFADQEIVKELSGSATKFLAKLDNTVYSAETLVKMLPREGELSEETREQAVRIMRRMEANISQMYRADKMNRLLMNRDSGEDPIGEKIYMARYPLIEARALMPEESIQATDGRDLQLLRVKALELAEETFGILEHVSEITGSSFRPFYRR
jgi:hypothetical protein